MDEDFGHLPPSFPLPPSTPPPPSSFSKPPPQFTLASRLKGSYRLPARYIDINPEPLRPLKEEDEQPTAALPCLRLIVRNRLQTPTNSFGLLREYLNRLSFDPDSFVILLRRNLPFLTLFKWPTSIFKFLPVPAEYHRAHFLFQDWSFEN